MRKVNLLFQIFFCIVALLIGQVVAGQSSGADTVAYDYKKIYSLCLDANVKDALALVQQNKTPGPRGRLFRSAFEQRFANADDQSDFLSGKASAIDDLLHIYHSYWRKNLLNPVAVDDSVFKNELYTFLKKNNDAPGLIPNDDSIDVYLRKYIEDRSLHTTGLGKTGRLFDLLVWRKEKDTTYTFKISKESISANVVLMDDFVTLGWEEYATLGRLHPGGWATKTALYCVVKSYDLQSERFRISYLAHESRHFADYKLFPYLPSADLEYRAKLVELSLAKTTLYELIEFFIANGNFESENGHQKANYRVIQSLSTELFKTAFQQDIQKWKTISVTRINKAANRILELNTKKLMAREKIGD